MNRYLFVLFFILNTLVIHSQNDVTGKIESILKDKQAVVGVAVIFDKDTITINNGYRYPMLSVFKFHQALAVLNYMSEQGIPLEAEVFVSKADLLPDTYSPLREKFPKGNFYMSVSDLLKYSVAESDNNACDILFNYAGGTEVVNRYIKSLGIDSINIVADEKKMHEESENQYLNWTTPLDAVRLLEIFRKQDLFLKPYRDFLESVMIETVTGKDKLKALLPQNAVVAHKTGSSSRNTQGVKAADNDIGFIRLPNRKYYSIAVFIMDSKEDDKTNASIIASISKAVYDYCVMKK